MVPGRSALQPLPDPHRQMPEHVGVVHRLAHGVGDVEDVARDAVLRERPGPADVEAGLGESAREIVEQADAVGRRSRAPPSRTTPLRGSPRACALASRSCSGAAAPAGARRGRGGRRARSAVEGRPRRGVHPGECVRAHYEDVGRHAVGRIAVEPVSMAGIRRLLPSRAGRPCAARSCGHGEGACFARASAPWPGEETSKSARNNRARPVCSRRGGELGPSRARTERRCAEPHPRV